MTVSSYPVLIVGMHRSGTTMVTRLLEQLGLFAGVRKDENHEALFFNSMNEWFFLQAGARWDHPESMREVASSDEFRGLITDYSKRFILDSPRTISYLGLNKYLHFRGITRLNIPWGWKSPLNSYTLPLWMDIFPNARVIHIYRHGVDVAQSLRTRGRRDMRHSSLQHAYHKLPFLHWIRPKAGTFIDSVRCDSLTGGLAVWEGYVEETRRNTREISDRTTEIKYEEFLANPVEHLNALAHFCALSCDRQQIQQVAGHVKPERAYAYLEDHELKTFAETSAARLQRYGY